MVAIHCNAVADSDWQRWQASNAGAVVWSPFSNLWLYGTATNIPAARKQGVSICLGSDWGPSGTKHVLGEIKVAKLVSQNQKFGLIPNRSPGASSQGRIGPHASRHRPGSRGSPQGEETYVQCRALWAEERPATAARIGRRSLTEKYKDFLTARTVDTSNGKFSYLRIWSFDVNDDQEFIEAVIKLLAALPARGLIIDLRDNPGGLI
jgi:Peptidase family S41